MTNLLFLIQQAIKAPSGHNSQPWLFRQGEGEIEIRPDLSRALPVVDPDNRELFISIGCAAENLCIAARHSGYSPRTSIAEDGTVNIELRENNSSTADDLFAQIARRQTNRSLYDGRLIPDETIALLAETPLDPAVGVHFFGRETEEFGIISEMVCAGNDRQMNNPDFKHELRQWMRYNKKHQDATHDGLSYAVFGAPNVPRFIAKPVIAGAINAKSQNKSDRKKMASSSHFALFTTSGNTLGQWINLGMTLERILLHATRLGLVHAYLNQPNEERELSSEMMRRLGISGEHPAVLLRLGYGKPMPYSLRRQPESFILPAAEPRRP